MNDKLKPLITLSQINSLPDGHLHSKVAFLKSIINEEQNPEILEMKQKVYKMSYTIKNIGIHGEEIGITSKRIPFKAKEPYLASQVNNSPKKADVYKQKYLPHNSFYSQALIPIKSQKNNQSEQENSRKRSEFTITSSINQATNFFKQNQTNYLTSVTKFARKMNKSTSQFKISTKFPIDAPSRLKGFAKKQNNEKQKQFIQKVTTVQKTKQTQKLNPLSNINPHKKSFSKLLNEHQMGKRQVEMVPLQHEQNSLFKKIKKLQKLTYQRNQTLNKRTQSLIGLTRNSSSFTGRYNGATNTARNGGESNGQDYSK